MKYTKILLATILTLAGATFSFAQKPVKFTSVYTRLDGRGCKTLRGGQGTDDATLCNGVGGYDVEVYYSAATMQIGAIRKTDDQIAPLATLNLDFDYTKSRLEWRLANGKPFAVIMRVPIYAPPKDGEYFGKVIGQQLIVVGLVGYEINEKVDAQRPNANGKAREQADAAFVSK